MIFYKFVVVSVVGFSLLFLWFRPMSINKIPVADLSGSHRICVSQAIRQTHNFTGTNGWQVYSRLLATKRTINISEYWNEEDRFRPLDMPLKTCTIVYCGANIAGTDGHRFALAYPSCHIYFLEPVLPFYEQLLHSSHIGQLLTSDRSSLYHVYPFGLSNRSYFVNINEMTLSQGQSLSLTNRDQLTSDQHYKLIVRDVAEILFEFKILKKEASTIKNELSLLHMNCEGCEYDVIERLLTTGLIKYIRHLQFGSHRPIEMQLTVTDRYCFLQSSLNLSHDRVFGIPWGWERWTRRNISMLKSI